MTLSNFQLEDMAKQLNIPIKQISMKDELPEYREEGNYIINLESTYQGRGTHWTALVVQPNISFYFDAFGELPSVEVEDFAKQNKKPLYFNNWIIQDINSSLCGFYCIAYLKYVTEYRKTKPLQVISNDFINLFRDNTRENGEILKKYLSKYNFKLKNYLLKHK